MSDIAAVAARYLADNTWTGQEEVGVLGPEDLSWSDMAAILTEVLGGPIRFPQADFDGYEAGLVGRGFSPAMAKGSTDMARAKDQGLDNAMQRTPENSTPTSFRAFAAEVIKPAFDAA